MGDGDGGTVIGSERARGALGPGSRLLERALSATNSGVMITDATRPDDPIVWVNGAFGRITGYAAEEVLGRNPRFLQAGDGDQPALDGLRDARGARNDDDVEWKGVLRNYKKDGTPFHNELAAAAVRSGEGRVTHHVGVITDVTERERAREWLRFQAQLLNAVGQAVVAVDLSGRIAYWNRAAEGLYGWAAGEAVGRPAHEVMVSEDQLERASGIWAELAAGRGWSGEFVVRRRDGTTFPAMVTNTPVFDEWGGLAGIIGVSADVTERKRAEEALARSEERFRQLFENSVDAAFIIHPETREIVDCNPEACRSMGYTREELLSLRLEDFALEILPEEEKRRRGPHTPWRRALSGEPGTIIGFHENVHRRKDGTTFPVEVGVGSIDWTGGRMVLASCRDTSERKEAEAALRESEERLRKLADAAFEGIVIHDGGKVLEANEAYAAMHGREISEIVGRPMWEWVAPEYHAVVRRHVLSGREEPYEIVEVKKDGTRMDVEVRGKALPYRGRTARVTAVRDVTERKALEERLAHQAAHDPLTGLPNRRLFMDRLRQALSRAERRRVSVAVLFVDLDDFKHVNDSLGHGAGDRLLVAVAGRLGRALRPSDTAARMGGDEFAVLLEDLGDAGEAGDAERVAERVAERIAQEMGEPFALDGRRMSASASVGVAVGGPDGAGPEDLLRAADEAMYRAKEGGKARHEVARAGRERAEPPSPGGGARPPATPNRASAEGGAARDG